MNLVPFSVRSDVNILINIPPITPPPGKSVLLFKQVVNSSTVAFIVELIVSLI